MSQYGAKGGAESGHSYQQILAHYYQGTQVVTRSLPAQIRIGLIQGSQRITVKGTGRFDFLMGDQVVASGSASGEWAVLPGSGGSYVVEAPNGQSWTTGGPAQALGLRYEDFGTLVTSGGIQYRYGSIEFNTHESGGWRVRSLIHLPLDQYLYGLGEMPSSWPAEALKAQVVAARTYAVEKMQRLGIRQPCNCHLFGDTRDQAYVGTASERPAWRVAVDATSGRVSVHNDQLIQAFYSSSSGGHTENNEFVWGGSAIPYLRGVSDPWDTATSPFVNWTRTFTRQELQDRLNADPRTSVGSLSSIEVLAPLGVSGRVRPVVDANRGGVRITGSAGTKRVSGDVIRSVLGLRSTLFRVEGTISAVHPDGTVLKGSTSALWVLRDGTRYPVGSPAVFDSQYPASGVVSVSDAVLQRYPIAQQPFREGTLLLTPDGRVWAVSNGLRRHVVSEAVFNALGYRWGNVRRVGQGEAEIHQVGAPIADGSRHPDGTLLKGSGPRVHVIENGKRRWIPSAGAYESQYRWEEFVTVPNSVLNSYPAGPDKGFRDGSLLHTPDGSVWAISNGSRQHVASEAVFNGLGYSWSNVRWVDEGQAERHEMGPALTLAVHPDGTLLRGVGPRVYVVRGGTLVPVVSAPVFESQFRWNEIIALSQASLDRYPGAQLVFREGTLIHTPDGRVWAISNGRRRHVASQQVFDALGYSWSNVRWISDAQARLHQVGQAVNSASVHPDGTVVRGSGPAVYVLQAGRKRWIPSEAVLRSRYRWEEVVSIPDGRLAQYPEGAKIGFRDGTLISTPDGKAWAISNELRRHVVSEAVFHALGYSTGSLVPVTNEEANLHQIGPPVS